LLGDERLRLDIHNIQREKIIKDVPDLLRTWEFEMTGPQPYSSAIIFIAEKDIERHNLPDNMIAIPDMPDFDLGEWLYPIKAGEMCWRIETFGHPWYYCPESQVKEGCKEKFSEASHPFAFHNTWILDCDNGDRIDFNQSIILTEEMSL